MVSSRSSGLYIKILGQNKTKKKTAKRRGNYCVTAGGEKVDGLTHLSFKVMEVTGSQGR